MTIHPSWKLFFWILGAVVAFAIVGIVVVVISEAALGFLDDPSSDAVAYLITAGLVFGDALICIFPGETTLNTASVLASDGQLELWIVVVAGFLGAFLGDNCLYWITRSIPALRSQAEKAQQDERVQKVLRQVSANGALLIIVCRFLPFVRWGVIAGMGILPMPYPRFLPASLIGALVWSAYTCVMAYWIGNALEDYPLASIAVACASSGVILGVGYVIWRRVRGDDALPA